MTHNVYTFDNKGRPVEFGPYLSEHEAKAAFQFAYGYWPTPAINTRPWKASS